MGAFLAELILKGLLWLLVLPVLLIVGTPVVLVAAFWGKERYWQNVRRGCGRITRLWGLLGEYGL